MLDVLIIQVLANNAAIAGTARVAYYVAHYVWPYHETVRMSVCPSVCLSVCLSVTCHISKTEPDRAIVTMDHYIEVGCN